MVVMPSLALAQPSSRSVTIPSSWVACRRICLACRVPDAPDPADLRALGIPEALEPAGPGPGEESRPLFKGAGCDQCRGTGYRGRMGIYELFVINEDVRSLIVRKAPTGEIRRHAIEALGMVTLREDGWAKAKLGITTIDEVLRVTQEEE